MPIDPFKTILDLEEQAKKFLDHSAVELQQLINSVSNVFDNLKQPLLFAQKLFSDNSLRELIGGKLKITEATLNDLVRHAMADNQEVNLTLALHYGSIEGKADVLAKGNPVKVNFKVNDIKIILFRDLKEIRFILSEAPRVELENAYKNIFIKMATSIIRSLHGEGSISKILFKDLEGVTVTGNEVAVDLKKVSALQQVVEAEIFGIYILEFIRVDKVETREGELVIHGGLKKAEK